MAGIKNKSGSGGARPGAGRKTEEKKEPIRTTVAPSVKKKAIEYFGTYANAIAWAVEEKERQS